MKAGGALVLTADAREAASRAAGEARASLGGLSPTFAVLFASAHFFGSAQDLVTAVAEETGQIPLIGCVAEGWQAGPARSSRGPPSRSGWPPTSARWRRSAWSSSGRPPGAPTVATGSARAGGAHLMICDPFTFPVAELLAHLNSRVPGAWVMGGLASGGLRLRQSRLFLDGRVLQGGAVGAHLPRAEVHPLVAQGCRPVGDPYTVTRAEANMIFELGGRPPLVRLRDLAAALPGRDRELLARGVQLGLVIDEYRAEPRQGDFLIRGVAGADPESGSNHGGRGGGGGADGAVPRPGRRLGG